MKLGQCGAALVEVVAALGEAPAGARGTRALAVPQIYQAHPAFSRGTAGAIFLGGPGCLAIDTAMPFSDSLIARLASDGGRPGVSPSADRAQCRPARAR